MSGGVDSSVAALLLKEQGYEVIGATMHLASNNSCGAAKPVRRFSGCCGSSDFHDAWIVAQSLNIPHYSFNFSGVFQKQVIAYFLSSYLAGETPNPCIACNEHLKFGRLLAQAQALGADFLATGHYARIEKIVSTPPSPVHRMGEGKDEGTVNRPHPSPLPLTSRAREYEYHLMRAVDLSKDQSYVLYRLGQAQLSHLLFPLGGFTKIQTREIARRYNLMNSEKPDSQEICFIPGNDYREFIRKNASEEYQRPGPILHKDGRVLGRHEGLSFYTIGQREGLGISIGRPLYVTGLDTQTNTLIVGEKEDVFSNTMLVRGVSWVPGHAPELPLKTKVKIRYKHKEAAAILQRSNDKLLTVVFDEPQSAITPGQAAVFYDGDVVLGGGVIQRRMKSSNEN